MRNITTAAIACLLAGAAMAQMGGKYGKMKIEHAGQITGNFKGAIESMTGGVKLELLSDDPAQGNLPIAADSIKFEWVEGSTQPARIVLEGDVRIKHPEADVAAQKAVWDFTTGELTFTGSPVMNSPRAQNMRGDKMTLNMNNGTFNVTGVSLPMLDLNAGGGGGISGPATGGGALSASDIQDWPGLVNNLKSNAKNDNTPGGHIVGMLDPKARGMLLDTPTETVVEHKGDLLKQLNKLLPLKQFYAAEAWQGVALPEETTKALTSADTPEADRTKANVAAFKAAFSAYTN